MNTTGTDRFGLEPIVITDTEYSDVTFNYVDYVN